nr:hypothetical protein Iba_scaffold87929CG0010 [Ipomoea batatas]
MTNKLKGSISVECILYELEAVQKTKDDDLKQNSFIEALFNALGSSSTPKECRSILRMEMHWILKQSKEDVFTNGLEETGLRSVGIFTLKFVEILAPSSSSSTRLTTEASVQFDPARSKSEALTGLLSEITTMSPGNVLYGSLSSRTLFFQTSTLTLYSGSPCFFTASRAITSANGALSITSIEAAS